KVGAHRPELILAELAEEIIRERGAVVAGARVVREDADRRARIAVTQAFGRSEARRTVPDDDEPLPRHPAGPLITPLWPLPRSRFQPRYARCTVFARKYGCLHDSRFANRILSAQAAGHPGPSETLDSRGGALVSGARSVARHQRVRGAC